MGARSLDHLLELPQCARCDRPVESIDDRWDPLVPGRVLTATCHGDREVSIVRDDDLRAAIPGTWQLGFAFTEQAYRGWRVMRGPFADGFIGIASTNRDAEGFGEVDLRDTFAAPRPYEPTRDGRHRRHDELDPRRIWPCTPDSIRKPRT